MVDLTYTVHIANFEFICMHHVGYILLYFAVLPVKSGYSFGYYSVRYQHMFAQSRMNLYMEYLTLSTKFIREQLFANQFPLLWQKF